MEVRFKCFARTPEEVIAAKGVKPTLSPNLNTLALVEVNLSFMSYTLPPSLGTVSCLPALLNVAKMGHES